ncbi:tripartite tricarboxylate transporter substrate-binding protein [Hahella ganghwensis]|uniref:tripartite tricarboxylate transporter substrate-binding protein n=1 Tax=Hahella ganghwensis TaxID=286420 RepID=UPI0003780DC7|nr:tripartite tricarboxylate transporter substrate-binding protein [Hahella ganghwensis]
MNIIVTGLREKSRQATTPSKGALSGISRYLMILIFGLFALHAHAGKIGFIHFLIPSGEGGGWDTTAREVGKVLLSSRLIDQASYQNLVGAGGGRAIIDMVENAEQYQDTLMVQSTPLLLRKLTGTIKYGFRDIHPVSIMITEYQAIAVPSASNFHTASELLSSLREAPVTHPIIGGSSYGSLDHISIELIARSAGLPPGNIRYVSADGGGEAMHLLEQGYGTALIGGGGEMVQAYREGKVRILGITSPTRLPELPEIATFNEQGFDVELANWRGFFTSPTVPSEKLIQMKQLLKQLNQHHCWADIRKKHYWSENFLQGSKMVSFLEKQERQLKLALGQLRL